MQRFLQIPELVEYVFEYAEMSALAASARTCRALSELALDTLWGIYGGFDALMSLLPDDIELEPTIEPAEDQISSCAVSFMRCQTHDRCSTASRASPGS
jgi:hypothetical protein